MARKKQRISNAEAALRVKATAQLLDDWVARAAVLALGIAVRQQTTGTETDPKAIEYLAGLLAAMPAEEVYGVYVAFDRRRFTDKDAMPWVDRASWPRPRVVAYDYHEAKWEWYEGPKRTGKPYVTEPYFDAGGSNIAMVSATRPVLDAAGRFIGVAGVDLSLEDIRGRLASLRWPDAKRAAGEKIYVASRRGKVLVHPNERLMLRESFDGEDLRKLPGGAEVAARASGTGRVGSGARERRLTWATAPLTGWKVALSGP